MSDGGPSGGGGEAAGAAESTPSAPQAQESQSPEKSQETTPKDEKGTVRDKPTGLRLPGVQTRDDDADIFPDLPRKGRDGKPVSKAEAEKQAEAEMREEKESFFGRQPEPKEDEAPKPPDPPPGADEKTDPNAPTKYKFDGVEYENQQAAEQSFRSLKGQFKPLQNERNEAVTRANQWKDYADSLEKRLAGQGEPSPAPQVQTPQAGQTAKLELDAEKILSRVDGNMFERIAQDPDRGLPVAGRFLAAQVLNAVSEDIIPALEAQILAKVKADVDRVEAPIAEQRAYQEAQQTVTNLFEAARGLKLDDGTQAFPELDNAETMMRVGEVWRNSGLPIEHALTPRGVQTAIALYRMQYGDPRRDVPPSAEPPKPTGPPPSAAASQSGSSSVGVGAGRQTPQSLFEQSLAGADLVDPNLGFAVRRRRE